MDPENSPHARAVLRSEARRAAEDCLLVARATRLQARLLLLGYAQRYLSVLLYPAVLLFISNDLGRPAGELLPLALGGFAAFGIVSLWASQIANRLGPHTGMIVFFLGTGLAFAGTAVARDAIQIAGALTAMGLFAAIYHPAAKTILAESEGAAARWPDKNSLAAILVVACAVLIVCGLAVFISWRAAFLILGIASIALGYVYWAYVPRVAPERRGHGWSSKGFAIKTMPVDPTSYRTGSTRRAVVASAVTV